MSDYSDEYSSDGGGGGGGGGDQYDDQQGGSSDGGQDEDDMPEPEVVQKKKRKKKDPNKPKGALTPFLIFSTQERPRVKEDLGPDAPFGDIARELGKRWKALTDDDKIPYQDEAKEDKARYQRDMENYSPPPEEAETGKGKKKKAKKDPNAPKKPLTAYFLFQGSKRLEIKEEHPGATMGEISKLVGAAWKELDDDEKAPFQKDAAKLKVKYDKDKKAYEASSKY